MTQKSYAEALRALVLYTATWQDRVMIAEHAARRDELAERVNDLLLPIVKGYGSERSWVLLGTESLQTFGGSGLPAGLPDRAVRPGRQDRHPLRGHDGDPGPGPVLPQDRQGPGQGARLPRRRDREVRRQRGRQRPPQERARAARHRAWRTPRPIVGHADHRPDVGRSRAPRAATSQHLQGRAEHHPAADGARRRHLRVAAAAPGGGRPGEARRRGQRPGQGLLRGQGRGGAVLRPQRAARRSPPSGPSPRRPTCR